MDVTGTWYNELNSIMELKVSGARLHGTYRTAVGDAAGPYGLHGWVDAAEAFPTLAFGPALSPHVDAYERNSADMGLRG
jgi:hypothetical protein